MKTITLPANHRIIAFSLATVWSLLTLVAQDLPFESKSTGADGPLRFREIPVGGRTAHGMAYDPVRQEVVLFGGYNNGPLGDTWIWRGTDWVRANPANSPLDRYGHRMVYDAERKEIVLFGGHRNSGLLNDTWVWNGTNWREKIPTSNLNPSPREYYGMAYDADNKKVVLFGGSAGSDETWLWDGAAWTQANPVTVPPGHSNNALAYDEARNQVVLFAHHGQTWLWDGVNWKNANPLTAPSARSHLAMTYDALNQEVVLFSGSNFQDTWVWNGTLWSQRSPAVQPGGRQYHGMVWDDARKRMLMFGGETPGVDNLDADTWLWVGERSEWQRWSGKAQTFDMSSRADGIWNYTSIDVPPGVTVSFKKNAGNTPIRWLASQGVTIRGTLDLSGQLGANALPEGVPAAGGPGGFDGGSGASRKAQTGSSVGSPGQGPGGGLPGTAPSSDVAIRDGKGGGYLDVYGNAFLQPLIGGSGGGGGSSTDDTRGGNGGGGGGAILIASSLDIVVDGVIRANGGDNQYSNASLGGRGSGGAILLRADRISGSGSLEAFGGAGNNRNGRIRLEGYFRSIPSEKTNPVSVNSVPAANQDFNTVGTLAITKVAGNNVAQPPAGNVTSPDVVFTAAGAITVEVSGTGIPDGTPVSLRIATSTAVINPPPVNLAGGRVTFSNVTVPAGVGTIQAFAEFNLGN